MTAYELASLYQANMDANNATITAWMGITFGVVVAAYFAGPRLTRRILGRKIFWFMLQRNSSPKRLGNQRRGTDATLRFQSRYE